MPNHVRCYITTTKQNVIKIKELIKDKENGLAEALVPMPQEIRNTDKSFPKEFGKKLNNDSAKLIDKYRFDNWYDWSVQNWGTKWGCYENEIEDKYYSFTTAWSPLDEDIIEKLAKIIPNFSYMYEEETGWGGAMTFENGVCIHRMEYDSPQFDEEVYLLINKDGYVIKYEDLGQSWVQIDEELIWVGLAELSYLKEEHTTDEGTFKVGYYHAYSLQEFAGDTLESSIIDICKNSKKLPDYKSFYNSGIPKDTPKTEPFEFQWNSGEGSEDHNIKTISTKIEVERNPIIWG